MPTANDRPPSSPLRAATTTRRGAKPPSREMTVTGTVGTRRERSPPEKSAIPHTAEDASASRTAAALTLRRRPSRPLRSTACSVEPTHVLRLPFAAMEPLRIGVLAGQGNFREHVGVLRRLGADVVEVRKADQLA